MTTRGFAEAEAAQVAHFIADVLDAPADAAALARVGERGEGAVREVPGLRARHARELWLRNLPLPWERAKPHEVPLLRRRSTPR